MTEMSILNFLLDQSPTGTQSIEYAWVELIL